MSSLISKKEKDLYTRIDEVIHYIWDPIGIAYEPGARDEYHSYLPTIYKLVTTNSSNVTIAEYLDKIQSENMGLPPGLTQNIKVSNILLEWAKFLDFKVT